jgi:EAL and modified HD-GYP domain-containing signal transduction protein
MNTAGQASAEKPNPWLARQPIVTSEEKLVGYELLFRATAQDLHFRSDAENATSSTIDSLNVTGLDAVCDGGLAFINCTHQMLLKDYFLLLPPDKIVIEIQETIRADEIVHAACQRLRQKRYSLALDNFVPADPRESLAPYVNFIKVDIRRFSLQQNAALAKKFAGKDCRMLAQKSKLACRCSPRLVTASPCFRDIFSVIPNTCAPATSPPTKPILSNC